MSQNKQISSDIVSRYNKDGTVIIMKLDDSNVFYKIDGVAAKFWQEFEAGNNIQSIKENILNEYNVAAETLDRDINILMSDLQEKGLVLHS